jgi:signal transduction histidine kinase
MMGTTHLESIIQEMKKLNSLTVSSSSGTTNTTIITTQQISSSSSLSLTPRMITKQMKKQIQAIEYCLQDICSTNTFMLMMINRCIDYTKASKGFKLVARNETCCVKEVINLPVQCMKSIQNKVKIHFLEYDHTQICTHIITDKQWLQENILCLLSNATKYSSGGVVQLQVKLLLRHEIHDLHYEGFRTIEECVSVKSNRSSNQESSATLSDKEDHHDIENNLNDNNNNHNSKYNEEHLSQQRVKIADEEVLLVEVEDE